MSEKPQYPPLRSPMIVDGQLTDPWIKYFQLVVTPYFEKLLNLEDMEALDLGDSQQKDHERRITDIEKLIYEVWQTNDRGFTKRLEDLETALQFIDGPKDATLLRKLDELETLIYGAIVTTGSVSDEAYNATTWDGVMAIAPSKNAVRDEFETHKTVQTGIHGLAITAAKTITCTQNTSLDEAVAMSSKLTIPGAWTTPAFDAGNFTASGAMTWTVAAGDVITYSYIITGKIMTVIFNLKETTVGGTPAAELRIAIPGSQVSTKAIITPCLVYDGTAWATGKIVIPVGGTYMSIYKIDNSNWTAGTDDHYINGEVTFEIN